MVGSAVGGILDQIADGTGVLLPDPADLAAFGSAVRQLLDSPDDARRIGKAGKEHIRKNQRRRPPPNTVGKAHRRDHRRLGQPGPGHTGAVPYYALPPIVHAFPPGHPDIDPILLAPWPTTPSRA